jgi:hypothetical protein
LSVWTVRDNVEKGWALDIIPKFTIKICNQ